MSITAVVTGITGQDGAYMAQLLLSRGCRVIGTHRQGAKPDLWRAAALGIASHPELRAAHFDMTDLAACRRLLEDHDVTEVYNFAGQSISLESTYDPDTAVRINALGPLNFLNAIRDVNPSIRFCQASSAEMFGTPAASPQDENTPFVPRTTYGFAKLHAHRMIETYRRDLGVSCCSAIMFTHESPLRGTAFLTRKITWGMAQIKRGRSDLLELGNLDNQRDWSFAGDIVKGMHGMLAARRVDDYVLASGRMTSVRRFAEMAAEAAELPLAWKGSGMEECGVDRATGKTIIKVNPAFCRPPESARMCGDASKAARDLNWKTETSIESLCRMMVDADLARPGRQA